jgi:RHS repeat-associated protein
MMTWQDYAGQTGAAVTTWKYDGYRGFLTNKVYAASEGPRYSYTKAGRLQVRTWARGTNTTYSYNNAGDLQSVDYADATPDVTYAYDRMGRPSQVTGATTNDLVYSLEGYLLSENVVNKAWNYTSQNRYGLDALKRRTALTNLTLGITHLSSYDAASRLQSVSTPDSGVLISYAYASNSPLVSGLTFQKGGFTRLTTSKQFDALERLMQVSSVPSGTSAVSSTYGYNAANQRTSLTNADGSYWRFGYDQLGQVTNGWRFWSDGSEVLGQTFNYAFDDVGNRRTVSAGAAASLRTQTYAVNALNQYTNRTVPGYVEASGSADSTASVTINGSSTSRHGEFFRQEVVVDNSGAPILQWLTNRAVIATGTSVVTRLAAVPRTPETISYDADGNLTQDGLWSYTWDGENRLTRIQTATNLVADSMQWRRIECSYDAMSRRVRKQLYRWTGSLWTEVESLRFFYDGWNLIGQIDEATGVKLSFAWGIDLSGTPQGAGGVGGLLAMTVHNGTNAGTYFYAYDGNGNVAAVINAADGSEAARYEYGPFAELTRSSGVMAQVNPFRYSTKYQDADSSLLCFGYRFFTPGLGRWLSRDSMDELGGVNLYCFVQNSAVNAIDPSGLFQVSLHKKITENAFDEESFKPVLKRKSYSKLLDGMKEGVEWVDLPGSFWSARDVFNPNQTLKKNPNKNSIWYKTHYGEYQFWHSMQNNEKTADELTQKIKAQILTYFNNGRKLYDECKFKEAGVEIGKGLHTIQDSFSKAHVVRDPFTGEITQFENYSAQDPHLHEKADEDTPGNERQITIATMISHRFLTIIFAEKYDASKVQILLDATFRIKSTGATMGGTAPEYKKP